jgi:hypothetical protein
MTREIYGLLAVLHAVPIYHDGQVRPWADGQACLCGGECAVWSTWISKDDFYETCAKFSYVSNIQVPCFVIYSYNESQRDVQYFSNLFDKVLEYNVKKNWEIVHFVDCHYKNVFLCTQCLYDVTQMLIGCWVQLLMLHELQISPRFNMCLVFHKCMTVPSKFLSCYLHNRSKSDIGLLVKSL